MYLIFRCDCGRAVYAKDGVKQKKCVCGKNLKVAERRIMAKTEDAQTASAKGAGTPGRKIWWGNILPPQIN